jgi:hypothetical protein
MTTNTNSPSNSSPNSSSSRSSDPGRPVSEGDPPTIPVTPDDAVRQLRTLQEQLPQMELSLSISRTLRGQLQHVDPLFVGAAVAVVGSSDTVQAALGRSDESLREDIDLSARWFAVADAARVLVRSSLVIGTVIKQRVGLAALQAYQICQQLERDVNHAKLSTHVAEMRRLNKFGRARRRTPDAETPPEPVKKPA